MIKIYAGEWSVYGLVALFFCTFKISVAGAFEIPDTFHGARSELKEYGLTAEFVYTGEYWRNVQGGLDRTGTYQDNLDVTLSFDTQQAGWWNNGTFFAYMLSNGGGERLSGAIVGDAQVVSNIEAPRTTRIYELWYEHGLSEELSVLLGVHDYNSEFNITETGGLFINSSFGIQPEITNGARPGVFPLAAPGVRIKYSPSEQTEFLFGVYDGDPGDPEVTEHFPRFDFDSEGGVFLTAEAGLRYNAGVEQILPGIAKLGFWGNTGKFDDVIATDVNANPVVRRGNFGGYFIIDQLVYQEKDGQGLAAFLQLGGTSSQKSMIDFYFGMGFKYTGLMPGRDRDEVGLAVARGFISGDLVRESGREEETVLELTYRVHLCENFSLQPDIQYVFNPNGDPTVDDAIVSGVRFEISL